MRRLCSLAVVSVVAVVFPASAGAVIQIDRGIAGARLGNTKAEVRAALGKPKKIVNRRNAFGRFTRFRYSGGIDVTFQGRRRVTSVSTTGIGDRTSRGVGVGSPRRVVENRIRGLACETTGRLTLCHTGDFLPGERTTNFVIRRRHVTRVIVGIVID
jgi:hypothetical protein